LDKVLIVKDIWVSAKETASRFIVLETIESDEDNTSVGMIYIFDIIRRYYLSINWENICRKKIPK